MDWFFTLSIGLLIVSYLAMYVLGVIHGLQYGAGRNFVRFGKGH